MTTRAEATQEINRFELKYVVSRGLVDEFAAALGGYMQRDPHAVDEHGYDVRSIYWDSPDRALFWEKVEGFKFRRKLRFRWYGERPEGVFVEIKQRIDRTIQKRRVRWPIERVRAVFDDGSSDGAAGGADAEALAGGDRVVAEALFLREAYGLGPAMAITYRRLPFLCQWQPGLRVTFDTNVRYAGWTPIGASLEGGKYVIDPDLAVMEIKFNDCVPRWMCHLIGRFGLSMVRMSKYCSAVDREFYGGRLAQPLN